MGFGPLRMSFRIADFGLRIAGIGHSSLIRHSPFVIRHCAASLRRKGVPETRRPRTAEKLERYRPSCYTNVSCTPIVVERAVQCQEFVSYAANTRRSGGRFCRHGIAKSKGGVGIKTRGITRRTFKPNIQKYPRVERGTVRRMPHLPAACLRTGKIRKAP